MTPRTVAISAPPHGLPAPAVEAARRVLEAAGYEVRVFADGRAMERHVCEGMVAGVLDLSPVELADPALAPERLTAAALAGVPQVISVCGLNGSPEQLDRIGQDLAQKASAARGPTVMLLPSGADAVLAQSIRNWAYPPGLVEEIDDTAFAEAAARRLVGMVL
jgi:uncharacterized protein (UPF0261 family)